MFKLLDRARELEQQGRKIIHLEIGDPDFDTPRHITDAAIGALTAGQTHYVSSWGIPEFIRAIQDTTDVSRKFKPNPGQVLVTPGANIAIFYAIFCLVNPECEVLVPDPGFPTYLSAIRMCGARTVPYPLYEKNQFRIRAEDIEPLISDKTRLLLINSPQNPTGAVTAKGDLTDVFDLAVKHDLYVYSDEIYSRMTYEEGDFFSIASCDSCRSHVILSNGFSKAFAMTGWRLGAVIGPEDVIERMMLLLQTTSSCVSPFLQRAGIAAIKGSQASVLAMMREYRARRDILVHGLINIPGVTCHMPGGAFYAFPNISGFGMTSEQFADYMLDAAGVAVLPGSNFGAQGEGFIRLCYAASKAEIEQALKKMSEACRQL